MVPDHYFTPKPQGNPKKHAFVTSEKGIFLRVTTAGGMFSYKQVDKGTELLLRFIKLPPEPARVLDLGAGYGFIAMMLAKLLPSSIVVALEINERAFRYLRKNLSTNNIENVEPILGDFFEFYPDCLFDAIYCNPPVKIGRKAILELIEIVIPRCLKPGGFFQIVFKTAQGAKYYRDFIESTGNLELREEKIKSGYRVFTGVSLNQNNS